MWAETLKRQLQNVGILCRVLFDTETIKGPGRGNHVNTFILKSDALDVHFRHISPRDDMTAKYVMFQ